MSLFSCPCCGLPAEYVRRFVVDSSDGPIEYLHACCIQLHRFTLPASSVAERVVADQVAEPPIVSMEDEIRPADPEPLAEAEPSELYAALALPPTPTPAIDPSPPPLVAQVGGPSPAEIVLFPSRVPFAGLRAPRTWLAGGAFSAGALTSGFLLNVPVALAFAVILGLLAVVVVASLIPLALASRKSAKVALLGADAHDGDVWTRRKAA
jgi:hypothetical protein